MTTDTINGCQVIASWNTTPRHHGEGYGRIILADRGEEYEERYVVAWQGNGDSWWRESAYCLDLDEARRVFDKRAEREVRR